MPQEWSDYHRAYVRKVLAWFHDQQGLSDAKIALMVSAHAGYWIDRTAIAHIRRGTGGYSGRNLRDPIMALARVWQS